MVEYTKDIPKGFPKIGNKEDFDQGLKRGIHIKKVSKNSMYFYEAMRVTISYILLRWDIKPI